MNRNVESKFALASGIGNLRRSTFVMPQDHKTTFNAGQLIPFYWEKILPGDTFKVETSFLVRAQTLMAPIMDNIYLDTFYFFVPNRLVYDDFQAFMGENTQSAWIPQGTYSLPKIDSPSGGWDAGTIADYLGVPPGVQGTLNNALLFRVYALICDQWFRDENLTDPLNIPKGGSTQSGSNGSSYVNDVANGGKPFLVSKYHDVFTSALPSPQKGPDVGINLGQLSGQIPVYGDGHAIGLTGGSSVKFLQTTGTAGQLGVTLAANAGTASDWSPNAGASQTWSGGSPYSANLAIGLAKKSLSPGPGSGVYADLSSVQSEAIFSINQLREAFSIQRFYEISARTGTRYIEILRGHFNVNSPDARLQRAEYLGGQRKMINVNQVVQTSETSQTSPQGNVTAYSVTSDSNEDFTHSFVEHGYIMGVCCVRYDHTYQQGLDRDFMRSDKFDFFWPEFANLGEQAIKESEIFYTGTLSDQDVFGYQEAWYDYRYKPNRVSGEMRSSYATSLDVWHLADDYASAPTLSDGWIREDASNIDRVLAVTSNVSAQFFGDFYIKATATRPMPVYSIPGLMRF